MTTLQQIRANRRQVWQQAYDLTTAAAAGNRALTSDEQTRFEALNRDLDALDARIAGIVDGEARARDTESTFATLEQQGGRYRVRSPADSELEQRFRESALGNDRRPIMVRPEHRRSGYQPGIEQRARPHGQEFRDLVTTAPANMSGVSFYDQIVEHLTEASSVLAAGATLLQTDSGEPLRVPRSTALSTAAIVAEGQTIPDSDPTVSSVALGAFKYAFKVQASTELVQDSGFDLQAYLAREAGQAIGLGLGAHLINGNGTGQPRGAILDATAGVAPTGTATTLGAQGTVGQGSDVLNNLYASLAEPYTRAPGTGWLMRSVELGLIRALKAATSGELVGNLLLTPPTVRGSAASLLGRPVFVDPSMPGPPANGVKGILFGDWSRYFVRFAGGIRFERSDEFAFDLDLVTWRALLRADGALVDSTGALKWFAHTT